jgi:GNAT superfamily N-acetyltransferase
MNQSVKSCTVEMDDRVRGVCRLFDYEFDGTSTFKVPRVHPPEDWGIGLIVGPSGSGKSSALASFGVPTTPAWDAGKAIVSHFDSLDDAHERLAAVGLNSIPSWVRPFHVLSTGEQFRANLSRLLRDGAVIDEFTSVVDRNVARSASVAIRRYCDKQGLKRIVLATCHYDVVEWLQPDWVFDTADHRMVVGRSQRRPPISIDVVPTTADRWSTFGSHHYLNESLNTSARCWLAMWGDIAIGFSSALAFPNGNFKNAWREHRTVVLPDYQGLGIGPKLSDAVASMFVGEGCRYFSKTAHPRLGAYRNASLKWRPTSKNGRARHDYTTSTIKTKEDGHKMMHANRSCFSHEYVGKP